MNTAEQILKLSQALLNLNQLHIDESAIMTMISEHIENLIKREEPAQKVQISEQSLALLTRAFADFGSVEKFKPFPKTMLEMKPEIEEMFVKLIKSNLEELTRLRETSQKITHRSSTSDI